MIIIEGMDNTGKSTLCQKLRTRFNIDVVHSIKPNNLDHMLQQIFSTILSNKPIIYDRHMLVSELVYGPVIRHTNVFGKYGFKALRLLFKLQPLIVYCRPSDETIFDFGNRSQMSTVIDNCVTLLNKYDDLINQLENNKLDLGPQGTIIYYDYNDNDSLALVYNAVHKKIQQMLLYTSFNNY